MVELSKSELERREIHDQLENLDTDQVYRIDELVEKYGEGLSFYVETDYYYSDCTVTIRLCRDRLETDEEYNERIEKLKHHKAKAAESAEKRRKTLEARKQKAKEKNEAEERFLYEKLKAKYG